MLGCEKLCFAYQRGEMLLKDVTFTFGPGRFYGIYGPNGSGKSTLLRLLAGELKPLSGKLFPQWQDQLHRARTLAVAEQSVPERIPLSVREVAALGRYPWHRAGADDKAVDEALEVLELSDMAEQNYSALSGGERQRVMLARALAQDTQILLLDEPGSSLDIGFQHTFYRVLRRISEQGKCVIMVSHDLFSAPGYLDEMVVMDSGEIVLSGTPDEVGKSGRLRRIFAVPEDFTIRL